MILFIIFIIFFCIYMVLHNYLAIYYIHIASFFHTPTKNKTIPEIKKVSIILPVFNEEKNIQKKLFNIKECIENIRQNVEVEILVGSDGSTDKTCSMVKSFMSQNMSSSWTLFDFANEGKCLTINKLVENSHGELMISTDCDVITRKDAFHIIIDLFNANADLGCLSCIPVFKTEAVKSQNFYWNQDAGFREVESKLGMLIVATGWLYGFRKAGFKIIPRGVMADDLWIPVTMLLQGYQSAHSKQLDVFSEKTDEKTEIIRRRRVMSGGMDVVKRLLGQLFTRPTLFFIVFSHKINRWLLPFWILSIILFSIFIYKYCVFVYLSILLLVTYTLGLRGTLTYIYAFFSPFLSFKEVLAAKDFSRWDHTR